MSNLIDGYINFIHILIPFNKQVIFSEHIIIWSREVDRIF